MKEYGSVYEDSSVLIKDLRPTIQINRGANEFDRNIWVIRAVYFTIISILVLVMVNGPLRSSENEGIAYASGYINKFRNFIELRPEGGQYDDALIAKSPAGKFVGTYGTDGVRWWKSIRYATSSRFMPPVAAPPLDTIHVADGVAPACMQLLSGSAGDPSSISEDCLFLTVSAPPSPPTYDPPSDEAGGGGYPVMVWIHGGAYKMGYGANCPSYDTTAFSKNDVVAVTFNYRLGVFGFLGSASLSGNYGFLDQRMALQWVQQNIAAFGGDPTRVTVLGQSAGAMSVHTHLVSPGSAGLFSAAVLESNLAGLTYSNRAQATAIAETIFAAVNCPMGDDDCMRSAPYTDILASYSRVSALYYDGEVPNTIIPFSPIVEAGGELPIQPYVALRTGAYPDVPLLVGFVRDEGTYFEYMDAPQPMSQAEYLSFLASFGADAISPLSTMYPYSYSSTHTHTTTAPAAPDGRDSASDIVTDAVFVCATLLMCQSASALKTKPPIFAYEFVHENINVSPTSVPALFRGRVLHGAEVPYVFGTLGSASVDEYNPTTEELQLSTQMQSAWSNFIKNHNPNSASISGSKSVSVALTFEPLDELGRVTILDVKSDIHTPYSRMLQCDKFWADSNLFPT